VSELNLEGFRPGVRDELDQPFITARIDQAPDNVGRPRDWTTIDTIAAADWLPPGPDDDPAEPAARALRTEHASDDPTVWYRVVFLDADDNESGTQPFRRNAASPYAAILDVVEDILARDNFVDAAGGGRVEAVEVALTAFEKACGGRSFVRRTFSETVLDYDGQSAVLTRPEVVQVTSASAPGGVTLDVADVVIADDEIFRRGWPIAPITVVYTAGPPETPADVARAIALLAADMLKDGPADDRGFAVTGEGGMVRMLTAGVSGAQFSLPEVQACLARYREPWVGS